MPDPRMPGVYIEETAFRAKAIEGVPTSTAGFVGACASGPVGGWPAPLTSLADFERRHGDGRTLVFGDAGAAPGYLWHAVRAFFDNGGRRLHVSRVFRRLAGDGPADLATPTPGAPPYADGHARGSVGTMWVVARHPGAQGNLGVRVTLRLEAPLPSWDGLADGDVVWAAAATAPAPVGSGQDLPLGVAGRAGDGCWTLDGATPPPGAPQRLTLSLSTLAADGRVIAAWSGLSLRAGSDADSLLGRFGVAGEADLPVVVLDVVLHAAPGEAGDALARVRALVAGLDWRLAPAELAAAGGDARVAWRRRLESGVDIIAQLAGGNDGLLPDAAVFAGRADTPTGLQALAAVEDIALVAAPGSTWRAAQRGDDVAAITAALVAHAETARYRVALLDAHEAMSVADVRRWRQRLDSRHAALYYPWVTVAGAAGGPPLNLPPSGFVAGICARVDAQQGVWKAPANEELRGAIGVERPLGAAEQELLNPEGINALRLFAGRGLRVWGARTVSTDPEWKYLNVRRYVDYVAHSLERGLAWAVFEPNAPALWAAVRQAAGDFLFGEWRRGALVGDKPERAFFVRCDPTTMTQADIDAGRLVVQVGVAVLKPAEFILWRVGLQALPDAPGPA